MPFIVHEHCTSTSAIDKYWLFEDFKGARLFFDEMLDGWKDFINLDFYRELDDCENIRSADEVLKYIRGDGDVEDAYVPLDDDDYLVITKLDSGGFGRRP